AGGGGERSRRPAGRLRAAGRFHRAGQLRPVRLLRGLRFGPGLVAVTGPHEGQPLLSAGPDLDHAGAAMVLIHGRGATAGDILTLVPELEQPGWTVLAPQAAEGTWYPYPFTAPIERNEPWLSSALAVVGGVLGRITVAGIRPERTVLLGFSQGACLTLEYAARNARRFGGVVGLSGGLIGP